MHPHFRGAIRIRLNDGQQLQPVAEFARINDVLLFHRAETLGVKLPRRHPEPVGQRREHGRLMGGVVAIDVEAVVGFRVTFLLGFGQGFRELQAALVHPGQDVIACAVDDSVDRDDPVGHQPLAQRADDRDSAGHARFKKQVTLVFGGELE